MPFISQKQRSPLYVAVGTPLIFPTRENLSSTLVSSAHKVADSRDTTKNNVNIRMILCFYGLLFDFSMWGPRRNRRLRWGERRPCCAFMSQGDICSAKCRTRVQSYEKFRNYANFVTIIIPKRNKNLCFSSEPPYLIYVPGITTTSFLLFRNLSKKLTISPHNR